MIRGCVGLIARQLAPMHHSVPVVKLLVTLILSLGWFTLCSRCCNGVELQLYVSLAVHVP